jgi:hypothetical protein
VAAAGAEDGAGADVASGAGAAAGAGPELDTGAGLATAVIDLLTTGLGVLIDCAEAPDPDEEETPGVEPAAAGPGTATRDTGTTTGGGATISCTTGAAANARANESTTPPLGKPLPALAADVGNNEYDVDTTATGTPCPNT